MRLQTGRGRELSGARYKTLVAVIGHHGSCQPTCSEKRQVVVPPDVFYKVDAEVDVDRSFQLSRLDYSYSLQRSGFKKQVSSSVALPHITLLHCASCWQVKVEVAQVDMHSKDEQVKVKAGETADSRHHRSSWYDVCTRSFLEDGTATGGCARSQMQPESCIWPQLLFGWFLAEFEGCFSAAKHHNPGIHEQERKHLS